MFSPHVLDEPKTVADLDHIIGALVVAISIISMAEVARAARFINLFFGVFAFVLLFFSHGGGLISHIIVGLLLIALTFPRGKIKERYGAWERYIV